MRFRKARGKNKAVITLEENEVIEACHKFLEQKGFSLGRHSYLVIPTKDKEDKLGRKRRRGIEYQVEVEELPTAEELTNG